MNEVTNFMYYMFNRWSEAEAVATFGEDLGKHIYGKWVKRISDLHWYAELDNDCRRKVVDKANEFYG